MWDEVSRLGTFDPGGGEGGGDVKGRKGVCVLVRTAEDAGADDEN